MKLGKVVQNINALLELDDCDSIGYAINDNDELKIIDSGMYHAETVVECVVEYVLTTDDTDLPFEIYAISETAGKITDKVLIWQCHIWMF